MYICTSIENTSQICRDDSANNHRNDIHVCVVTVVGRQDKEFSNPILQYSFMSEILLQAMPQEYRQMLLYSQM